MTTASERRRAFLALAVMPFLFSTNIVLGRAAVAEVEPFTLAFLRWAIASLILWALAAEGLRRHRDAILGQWRLLAVLAFMMMVIGGGGVYYALKYTSATNGTLIFTTASVVIVLLDWLFRGTPITGLRIAGIVLGLGGVGVIVTKGSLAALTSLQFNAGDLIIALAMLCWSIYSIVLKRPSLQALPTIPLFAAIATMGALVSAPFAVVEIAVTGHFPTGLKAWASVLGLAVFASVAAFSAYQYGLRVLGPSIAGMFIYLFPPAGVLMAVVFLGEVPQAFHFAGFVLILVGLILATAPIEALKARFAR